MLANARAPPSPPLRAEKRNEEKKNCAEVRCSGFGRGHKKHVRFKRRELTSLEIRAKASEYVEIRALKEAGGQHVRVTRRGNLSNLSNLSNLRNAELFA